MMLRTWVVGWMLGLVSVLAQAQGFGSTDSAPLPADKAFLAEAILSGTPEAPEAFVRLTPAPGYYVYQDRARFTLLEPVDAGTAGEARWAESEWHDDAHFGRVRVFHKPAEIHVPLPVLPATGEVVLEVRFQGCQAKGVCYPPMTRLLNLRAPAVTAPTAFQIKPAAASMAMEGSWWVLMWVGLGLVLAFTPCTLPALPLVHSLLTHGESKGASRRVAGYVVGHTLVFAGAGLAAGLMGAHLTVWAQQPVVLLLAVAMMVAVAFSQFGWWHPRLPLAMRSRLETLWPRRPSASMGTAVGYGALAALVVGPCVAPPLAVAVGYLAQTGDPWRGTVALVALSLGMGLPLLVMGTAWERWVPRQGAWMATLQRWSGIAMLGLAVWLGHRVWPSWVTAVLVSMLVMGVGIWGLHRSHARQESTATVPVWQPVGSLLLVTLGLAHAGTVPFRPNPGVVTQAQAHDMAFWTPVTQGQEFTTLLAGAREGKRPVMLDFYADWCSACQTMEKETFADAKVKDASQPFDRIQVDLTDFTDAHAAMLERFGLVGPPATLFWDAQGTELSELRLYGAEAVQPFVQRLNQAQAGAK